MENVVSEIIRNWGTFGVLVVLLGFIIYDKFIKKQSLSKTNNSGKYDKEDLIYEGLKEIKDSLETNVENINNNVDSIKTSLEKKIFNMETNFNTQISEINTKVNSIPVENVKQIVEEFREQERIEYEEGHNKALVDALRLGEDIQETLLKYTKEIECQHIFVGSFHNGSNSLSGIPYIKFNIIFEVYNPEDTHKDDHDFAPVYRDCDLTTLGKLPRALIQQKLLYFKLDKENNTEMLNFDQIIPKRMAGLGIKQIALHVTQENSKPSGFVGCVRYDDKEMEMDALKLCVKELEIIHNNTYYENNHVL